MKLPVFWLKKYIDVGLSAEALAERLTLSGTKVEAIEKIEGEPVLVIEVTTNRPDCLSLLGLAREVSALTGKKIGSPLSASLQKPKAPREKGVSIRIEDKKACPLYTARILRDVGIKPAPPDAQKCLLTSGLRPIHNAVDATNFVLLETGQPLHAFDLDKLKGGITVRWARPGEKFLGIDDTEYILNEKILVIADEARAVAVAGVIGGKETEVTESTKNILLESAYFEPVVVRRASRTLGVSTDSSYRFERGVDPAGVVAASRRASRLILEWAGGEEGSFSSQGKMVYKEKKIILREERLAKLLGMRVPLARVKAIFASLGFETGPAGKARLSVHARSVRRDLTEEVDLIEEVARIVGFDKMPVELPATRHPLHPVTDRSAERAWDLKKNLAASGLQEISTYSLLSKKALADSGITLDGAIRRIANAMSAEQECLRPSLVTGMLGVISFNAHRKAASLKLFEVGRCFAEGRERICLSMGLFGAFEENWRRKSSSSFFEVKGLVENVLHFLQIESFEWREKTPPAWYDKGNALSVEGAEAGFAGIIAADVLSSWDIPHEVFYAELDLDCLLEAKGRFVKFSPIPKFPGARRDIAFVIDEAVPVKDIEAVMKEAAAPYAGHPKLFDEFTGKNIPAGKRSLAFSLSYQKSTGTFTDEEIAAIHARVGSALKEKFSVELR